MNEDLESKALRDLANLEQEDEDLTLFQPYKSISISQQTKTNAADSKQKTIYFKQKTSETHNPQTTKR